MSLINEALKKAQRQRADEAADLAALMPGGNRNRVAKRDRALSTQSIVLLATGGVALFVVCVVVSVIWINQPAPAKPGAPKAAVATKPAVETNPPATVALPRLGPEASPASSPAPSKTEASATPPAAKLTKGGSAAMPVQIPPETPAPTMASARSAPLSELATSSRANALTPPREPAPSFARPTEPAAAPAPLPLPSPTEKFDERVQALVDAFRVSGIRASGSGSKVLLTEKVFKINDVVDRTSGLRLTQVANDKLTFTTADGVTYVKTF